MPLALPGKLNGMCQLSLPLGKLVHIFFWLWNNYAMYIYLVQEKNLFIWIVFIKIFLYMSQSQRRKCYKSFVSLGNSLRRNICNKQYLVYIYCWQQSRQRKFLSYETTCTAICSVIYWGHLGWHSWKNFCQYLHLPECIATEYKMHNVWSWEDFFLKKA